MRKRKIEEPSVQLAIPGLALGLQLGLQPARSDSDVGSLLRAREQLVSLVNWRRQIGVGKQQHVAVGVQHPIADAVSLAAIAGIFHQPDIGIAGGRSGERTSAVSSLEPSFTTMISLGSCRLRT